jgi:hypothetical protein
MERTYLPVNAMTAPIYWSLSEHLMTHKDQDSARRIWEYLRKKGTDDIVEVRYAKSRLDNRKTEVEDLWNR